MPKFPVPKFTKKGICITLLVVSVTTISGFFANKAYQKHREEKAIELWDKMVVEAQSRGIHINIDDHLKTLEGPSPKFIEDFPWVNDFMNSNEEDRFAIHNLTGFKTIQLPTSSKSHLQNLEELRLSLSSPPMKGADEEVIYKDVLSAIEPANEELAQFKSAIEQSRSLGLSSGVEELFFLNASSIRDASQLLLLRAYCKIQLGSQDLSDISAVTKLSHFMEVHGAGLLTQSVQIAIDLLSADIIQLCISSPRINTSTAPGLLHLFPDRDVIQCFDRQMRLELGLQLYWLNQIVDGKLDLETNFADALNKAALYKRLELRSHHLEFALLTTFLHHTKSGHTLMHPDTHSSQDYQRVMESKNYPEYTANFIGVVYIGADYYLEAALKAQLTLDTAKLGAACEVHKKKLGYYPKQLSDLVPAYLPADTPPYRPLLPYTNEPYAYTLPTKEGERPTISGTVKLQKHDDITVTWPEDLEAE